MNISKCCSIVFSHKRTPLHPQYYMNSELLSVVPVIKDLGVYFDSVLKFDNHCQIVSNRAAKMLGFIIRHTSDFTSVRALQTLYSSLVRCHMDYCSVVWFPYYRVHLDRLERVQSKFIRYMRYKLSLQGLHFDFQITAAYMGLTSIEGRFVTFDLLFIFKVINNIFNVPDILADISFSIPSSYLTRQTTLIYVPPCRTNYALNCPSRRMARSVNKYCQYLDFTGVTISKFKSVMRDVIHDQYKV